MIWITIARISFELVNVKTQKNTQMSHLVFNEQQGKRKLHSHHNHLREAFRIIQRDEISSSSSSSYDDDDDDDDDNFDNKEEKNESLSFNNRKSLLYKMKEDKIDLLVKIFHILLRFCIVSFCCFLFFLAVSKWFLRQSVLRPDQSFVTKLFEPQRVAVGNGSYAMHMYCTSPWVHFMEEEPIKLPISVQDKTTDLNDAVTYILEASPAQTFMDYVYLQNEIKQMHKETDKIFICSFDRLGNGLSSIIAKDIHNRTISDYSRELSEALTVANLPQRFVYVTHSLSSHFAQSFARQNSQNMIGMMLLDPWFYQAHEHKLHTTILQRTKLIFEYLEKYWCHNGLIRWLWWLDKHPWSWYVKQLPSKWQYLAWRYYSTHVPYESFTRETNIIQQQLETENYHHNDKLVILSSVLDGPDTDMYFYFIRKAATTGSEELVLPQIREMYTRETLLSHQQAVNGDLQRHVIVSYDKNQYFAPYVSREGAKRIAQVLVCLVYEQFQPFHHCRALLSWR
jgi:hypothetical protein